LGQIIGAKQYGNVEIKNIVLMGSGEPFDNYNEVLQFIRLCGCEEGLNIGMRRITVSTCGLANQIIRFAQEGLSVNLSISLHAPFHHLREEMMPIEHKHPLPELMEACFYFREVTKRRLTFEYCVLPGKNDTVACAKELGSLLKHTDSLVNLIGENSGDPNQEALSAKAVKNFASLLDKEHVPYTIRRKLGSSINAACGQLKCRYLKEKGKV